ncbi:MAG: hypothetical protein KDC84_07980 [Crocinitomicaceae bacterium]|nr:hypothetical protein [Crocinitomicaceae bacterium]
MKHIFIGILTLFLFLGCKKQPIPAFISIDNFQLVNNPTVPNSVEGELTQDIDFVLLYVNGNNLGYYELPIRVPVLAEGVASIKLYPCVKQNGISGTVIDYPFYKSFDTTLNLVPEAEYSLSPTTMYTDNISTWIMDFEGANSLNSQPNSVVDMIKITDTTHVKYGTGCGYVHLTTTDSMWNARTSSLATPSGKIWVELDYKISNTVLNTFVAGYSGGLSDEYPYLYLNPETSSLTEWKKIYIDFTENRSAITDALYYEAGFTAILDPDKTFSDIYFDNVKIIYFQ